MKGTISVVAFILLTAVCWGVYGPMIQEGQKAMGGSRLRPFVCVGIAYFVIAVIAPIAMLRLRGESGRWTTPGVIWSLLAGAAGAIGALGIILAFSFGGQPLYVMPLVFGGAPVVNTVLTMYMGRTLRQIGPVFLAGLIIVALGAATVLITRPRHDNAQGALSLYEFFMVATFVAMTAIAWGAYGPVLHKGQLAMGGSRLRPFICVGLAYFVVAVIVPLALLNAMEPEGAFTVRGTFWSLAGGAAGAVGALGIIMAFTAGGRPIYVMPLVFGGAPVVNSLTEVVAKGLYGEINAFFYAGLILVIGGAVMVLVFAPKAQPHPVNT